MFVKQCPDLVSVVLPDTLEKMGDYAFANTPLETVEIPDSVTKTGKGCFSECEELTAAVLPKYLAEVSEEMFNKCYNLTKIVFPENLSIVRKYAFNACGLILKALPQSCTIIEECGFNGCFQDEDGSYPAVEEFVLPKGLVEIGRGALSGLNCSKLVIPASVKLLGEEAFSYLSSNEDETVDVIFEEGFSAELPKGLFYNHGFDSDIASISMPSQITVIHEIFLGTDIKTSWDYVKDEYGRYVYDINGEKVIEYHTYEDTTDDYRKDLIIYCDPGSAAMKFAREKGIECAKRQ